mmetsp:Transcript_63236/g.173799  ORF Transcript_63236/g.173799 Transcript_63236/m.173799 type:complete len:228 (-) Transcript_63236:138-821(-)
MQREVGDQLRPRTVQRGEGAVLGNDRLERTRGVGDVPVFELDHIHHLTHWVIFAETHWTIRYKVVLHRQQVVGIVRYERTVVLDHRLFGYHGQRLLDPVLNERFNRSPPVLCTVLFPSLVRLVRKLLPLPLELLPLVVELLVQLRVLLTQVLFGGGLHAAVARPCRSCGVGRSATDANGVAATSAALAAPACTAAEAATGASVGGTWSARTMAPLGTTTTRPAHGGV